MSAIATSDPAAQAAAAAAAVAAFNTELLTLYAFGILMTIFRTYARIKSVGYRNLRADDLSVWLAIVCVIKISHSLVSVFANGGSATLL